MLPAVKKKHDVVRARKSGLRGSDLAAALKHLRVPVARFARHAGLHEATTWRWIKQDAQVPPWAESILAVYWLAPASRRRRGSLALPWASWGIDRG